VANDKEPEKPEDEDDKDAEDSKEPTAAAESEDDEDEDDEDAEDSADDDEEPAKTAPEPAKKGKDAKAPAASKETKAPSKATAKEPAASGKGPGGKAPPKGPTPVHIGGESIMDRLLPHIKKIAVGAVVVAVILMGVFGFRWWKDRARQKRTSQLARAMDLNFRNVEAPDPTVTPDPANPPAPTFPTYKDRATAILAEIDRGAGDVTSSVYKGSLLLDAGNLDGAAAAFRQAAGRKDIEGALAREGLGFVEEARAHAATDAAQKKQHLEAALAAFRAVQPDDAGIHRDHALYHEGRILQWMEQRDAAVAAYEKALEVVPESELESEISTRLAMLGAEQ
jgi:predicted negative regulator of RcsB-dependent stress response